MKYFRVLILFLILCNVPSYALVSFGSSQGAILSLCSYLFIFIYFFISRATIVYSPFIIIGILYFLISVLVDQINAEYIVGVGMKYFIFVILGFPLVSDSKNHEIYFVLVLGGLSVIYESIFGNNLYGRFSGFYLNPNSAGFVSLFGFCISMVVKDKKLKVLGQILFSVAGLLTFSRTFLLLWSAVNIFSVLISFKNIYKIVVGVLLFSLFLSFGQKFNFNTRRLEAFSSVLDGKISDNMGEGSRTVTWASYYDRIIDNPVAGNGYLSFSGQVVRSGDAVYVTPGVHNTFLMILGEAGFFVLLFFTWVYCGFIVEGIKMFKENSLVFFTAFSLFMFMLTSHNFFDNNLVLFMSLWLYIQIENDKSGEITVTNHICDS